MNQRSLAGPKPSSPTLLLAPHGVLQRACACGQHSHGGGECEECRKKREGALQREATNSASTGEAPPIVHEVLNSPGQPLDAQTRAFMEPRFGHDFSRVRVHNDSKAAQSARAVNARAYTVGENVAFGAGEYAPETSAGQRLLAHELTHVVQQQGGPTGLQPQSLTVADDNNAESEAHIAAEALTFGHSVQVTQQVQTGVVHRQPVEPPLTADNAGGCGICFRGDLKSVGNTAHRIIQQEFEVMYPNIIPEFPIKLPKKTHIISEGRPDLVLPTPTGFKIGEIKPANPNGYIEGAAKIEIYRRLLIERYKKVNPGLTVEPLDLTPPPPLPFVEPQSLSCTQLLITGPAVGGVYGYLCDPPFSFALRQQCQCEGDKKPPPVPVGEKAREKVEEKKRLRVPGPEVMVPVTVGAGALAWAATKIAGKKLGGPAVAAATVIAAIVLFANGAEAGAGGDDPMEALFKMASDKGTPLPEDLKKAIRDDPALQRIIADAAHSKNKDEARRKLGEQLTRVIIENRDQFTAEEAQELLKVNEENKDVIPNAPVTAEVLRRSLDAKARGAKGESNATGGGGGSDTGAEDAKQKDTQTAPAPTAQQPPTSGAPNLSPPAQRLVDAIAKRGGDGPQMDEASLEKLREIVRSVTPPLTEAEVEALLPHISSAEGKTVDEVLESVRGGIRTLRNAASSTKAEPSQPNGDESGAGDKPSKTDVSKSTGDTAQTTVEAVEKPVNKKPDGKKTENAGQVYAKALSGGGYDFLKKGEAGVVTDPKQPYILGKTISVTMVGRGDDNILFMGGIVITAKRKVSEREWVIVIHSGAKLYAADGSLYSTTRKTDIRVLEPSK